MLDLRTAIVQEMESGSCRNLLEPRAQQPKFMHQPLDNGESMWPMVLGTIFCPSMLVVAFIAGRQSVHLGFCGCFSSCCGRFTSPPWSHTEAPSSSEESNSDIENNLLGLSNMTAIFPKCMSSGMPGPDPWLLLGKISSIDCSYASARPTSTSHVSRCEPVQIPVACTLSELSEFKGDPA